MEVYEINNYSFTYPGRTQPTLDDISLTVEQGEFVVLCGESGSGKSTLLRNLKQVLAPHGESEGEILFAGRPLAAIDHLEQAMRIGYVFQNPDAQIVTDKVWHELAFGLESLGLDTETIRLRVAEMASFFGIQQWFYKDVNHLSGGQKQLLNLAAVMVMQPEVLILDEPTSQLDPIAAGDFLDTLMKINRELGTTIIITEHRLEDVIPMADRVLVLGEGQVIADGKSGEVADFLAISEHPMFMAMPTPIRAYALVKSAGIGTELNCPENVREGRRWLSSVLADRKPDIRSLPEDTYNFTGSDVVMQIKDVWFRYEKDGDDIIKDFSLSVKRGEFLAIVGGNGTGKSTALSLMCGLQKPLRGKVKSNLTTAMLPQNPQTIFVANSVRDDLREITSDESKILEIAALVGIEHLLDFHPYDLSGGEQQRAALAKVMLLQPQLLLLDEPTKGLDNGFKFQFAEILATLSAKGVTIVMVSHDVEFCARFADRCAMIFNGQIITEGTPRSFFSGNSFYTTAGNRMSRHVFLNAVTAEDIAELLCANFAGPDAAAEAGIAGKPAVPAGSCTSDNLSSDTKGTQESSINDASAKLQDCAHLHKAKMQRKIRVPHTLLTAGMMLMAVITVFVGFFVMENKHYLAVCILLALYAMVPFFAAFEDKKPSAREIVILAVLIATAVVGRGAFFMVPFFKPIVAIIIISAIAYGKDAGFMVGAMSAFVSNFIFGQGPWTPWQMIAMAVIGYLAGMIFYRYRDSVSRLPLLIFGGISTFFIYGAIVDIWTILTISPEPTLGTIVAVYGAAVYPNLVHAFATVIFLAVLARPMLGKLNRVSIKYGMGFAK